MQGRAGGWRGTGEPGPGRPEGLWRVEGYGGAARGMGMVVGPRDVLPGGTQCPLGILSSQQMGGSAAAPLPAPPSPPTLAPHTLGLHHAVAPAG